MKLVYDGRQPSTHGRAAHAAIRPDMRRYGGEGAVDGGRVCASEELKEGEVELAGPDSGFVL
jgi:hypothetical protein